MVINSNELKTIIIKKVYLKPIVFFIFYFVVCYLNKLNLKVGTYVY
jgi:hypothetical protein